MGKYDSHIPSADSGFRKIPAVKIIAWIENNFEYQTRKGGDEYLICDPFKADHKFKFNINPDRGYCHSWLGDEWAGPVNPKTGHRNCSFLKFVKVYRNCSFGEAVREVLGATGEADAFLRSLSRPARKEAQKKASVALPEGSVPLTGCETKPARALIAWLKSRGYSDTDIQDNEIHYVGLDVVWPYFEFDELVYWQSRSRLGKQFTFPSGDEYEPTKAEFLYGFDDVNQGDYLVITEAIFDKHALGEQAVASGGAILAPKQISKINILGPKKGIILAPDNDKAGINSIISNAKLLTRYPLYYSLPPKYTYKYKNEQRATTDWNDIGRLKGLILYQTKWTRPFAN